MKRLIMAGMGLAAGLTLSLPASALTTVGWDLDQNRVLNAGDENFALQILPTQTVTVDLLMNTDEQFGIGGFDVTYQYVTSVLDDAANLSVSNPPWVLSVPNGIDDLAGTIQQVANTFTGPLVSGNDIGLFSVEFTGAAFGESPLLGSGGSQFFACDEAGPGCDDDNQRVVVPEFSAGQSVQVVPIPAAVWLFGSAVLGLIGGLGRRLVTSQ